MDKHSNYETIKLLLEFGADFSSDFSADFRSRDSKGRTAYDIGIAFRFC